MKAFMLAFLFIVFIFIVIFAISRRELFPSDGRYIVNHVESVTTKKDIYQLIPVVGFGGLLIRDTVGKYHKGDTLFLSKKFN